MKKSHAVVIAGGLLGFSVGSSIGIAAGGTAINGAWVCGALGAFIGWLIRRDVEKGPQAFQEPTEIHHRKDHPPVNSEANQNTQEPGAVEGIVFGAAALIASFWNFHIELLFVTNLLDKFCKQPWLFVGLGILMSLFFPPFAAFYFVSYVWAAQFGASKDTQFRAQLN